MDVTDGKQINPALSLIADAWSDSLSKSDLETFKRKGYLQYNLDDKLVVLTLNTVPYSVRLRCFDLCPDEADWLKMSAAIAIQPSHSPDTTDKPDPFGQFEWLQSTLTTLKKKGKYAYIVGHIPPMIDSYSGAQMWEASYISTYKQIVGKYASVVKAQLFGHVHSIEFRVPLNEEQDRAAGFELVPLFTTAAISPIYDNNPAFMTWDYHPTTYELLDYAVYGTNISDGSANDLSWKLLFKASQYVLFFVAP
jgi:sphingomyelin phosphodiesterase acid-like 3